MKLERKQKSLRIPILIYIYSFSDFLEPRYINLFRALEKLVDEYSPQNRNMRNLSDEEFDAIKASIKEIVPAERLDTALGQANQIRWAGFKKRLQALLAFYKIDYEDIGGVAGLASMYQIRNKLIHKSSDPDYRDVSVEAARLETIFERILFGILRWKGETESPTHLNSIYLSNPTWKEKDS